MKDLYDLIQSVKEEVQSEDTRQYLTDGSDVDDMLHEIADGWVPIYTSDLMQLAADNIALAVDEPELGRPAFDGSPTPVNIVAANVYERLLDAAYEAYAEIESELEDKA